MKKACGILLLFLPCFMLIGINYAGGERESALAMKSFSVSAPPGWTAETRNDDGITFRVPGSGAGEASISVAAYPPGAAAAAPEASWGRLRAMATYRNGIPREAEERFSGRSWRVLDHGDEVGGVKTRCVTLLSEEGNTRYLIRFDCPASRYETLLPAFRAVKDSFTPADEERA